MLSGDFIVETRSKYVLLREFMFVLLFFTPTVRNKIVSYCVGRSYSNYLLGLKCVETKNCISGKQTYTRDVSCFRLLYS